MSNKVVVLPTQVVGVQNANLTAAGSFVAVGMGIGTVEIVTNLTAAPAGTITISAVEVDAGDQVTALGSTTTESALSTLTTQKFAFTTLYSGVVKVSWTVTGGGAQGVYITATAEVSGGGGGGGTVTQGTAAAVTAPWPVELSNGANAVGTSGAPLYVESVAGSTVALAAGSAAIGSVTVTGTPAVSATQGTAAAVTAPWPVELSNGANAVGTSGAPLYVEVTNGTQNMPTGDAQARAIQVTTGDGTHTTPAGDAVSRARYNITTDGTNVAAVKAASTAPVASDPASVVSISPNAAVFSSFSQLGVVSYEVKSTAGVLKSVHAANRSTSALYLQIFNATTATGTPAWQFQIPAGSQILIGTDYFVGAGWQFSTACTVGVSSVAGSYTAFGTAANIDLQGFFL